MLPGATTLWRWRYTTGFDIVNGNLEGLNLTHELVEIDSPGGGVGPDRPRRSEQVITVVLLQLDIPQSNGRIKVPVNVLLAVQVIINELGTTRIRPVYILRIRWLVDGRLGVLRVVVRVFPVLIASAAACLFPVFGIRVHGWAMCTVVTPSPPVLPLILLLV